MTNSWHALLFQVSVSADGNGVVGSGAARQCLPYGLLDGCDLVLAVRLLTVKIPDIENIDYLIGFGADLGNPDIKLAPEKGVRNFVEKPRKIVG
ncbi:MAG: hypothetical protein JRJ79_17765, partial [Deltaproteobacteria bacterium]|nr:hypothetical protein [Deltaproteobacteria bacterium]